MWAIFMLKDICLGMIYSVTLTTDAVCYSVSSYETLHDVKKLTYDHYLLNLEYHVHRNVDLYIYINL